MKRKFILFTLCLIAFYSAYAQQRTISGVVRDSENNRPLSGVSVVVKESTKGVSTDANGKYTIQVSPNQVLVYSILGMKTSEIRISGSTPAVLDVVLQPEEIALEDVVVVGYGVSRRRDVAGSISSLNPDNIEAGVISNMSQILKGRAAGVQVRQNSLEPGGGVSVRVRGASSVSAENEPLYVVDGFQTDNMAQINPDDIASIEVLKDASTTAIYGARGANGVILITTKTGKSGQFNVDYSFSESIKNMYNPWDLLDAGETISLTRRLYEEDPTATSSKWTAEQAKYRGKGTDWVEETTRRAVTNLHQLSIAGGGDRLTAFVSANYFTEPGVLLGTDYQRFGGRANVNYKITDKVRAGANTSFAHSTKKFLDMGTISSDQNIIYRIFNLEPWKNKEGVDVFGTKDRRPGVFDEMNGADLYQRYNTMYGTVFAEADLLPSLLLRGQYTYGYDHMKTQKYYDRSTSIGQSYRGQAFIGHEETSRHQLESVLTWHQKFGVHDLKMIGGTSYITQLGEGDEIQAFGFASDVFTFKNIGAAEQLDWIGSGQSTLKKSSFFSRAEYVLANKYILNASLRADGSSVFGANHRWGYFPAASAAWHIGDEAFMDFAKPLFSTIKLRTSYGLSGNDGIRFGLSQYQYSVRDVYIGGSDRQKGMFPSNPYNPNLKWETTAQWNIGADFMLLRGKIEANMDFFVKQTKDLLNPTAIHPSGGFPNYTEGGRRYEFTAMMVNDGKVDNRGFELNIKSTNISKEDFTWNSTFNMSTNRSRVTELNDGQPRFQYIRPHGSYDEKEYIILQEGKPLSAIYGYVFDGIIQQGETYGPQPNSVAGDPKFKDLNGDGIINGDDREVLGQGTPRMILGLSNTFVYKGFDFSFFLDASLGGKMLNLTRIYLEDNNRLKDSEQRWTLGGRNLTDENGNAYTTEGNPSNTVPRKGYQRNSEIQYGSYINSRFVENSDYLKLRNIELGYTPALKAWGNTSHYIKSIQVFIGAQNLVTLTGYTGFDPDISTNGSSSIAQGLDLNSYPAYRMFNFGAKVTF